MSLWKKVLFTAACAALAQPALAQTYPEKPITLIVPFAPGATSDAIGRLTAEKLKDALGVSVLVDNRPGAGGSIGTSVVARAAPDGYTLLIAPGANALAKYVMKSPPFQQSDFAPISNLVYAPYVVAAATNQPFTTLKDMVAYAKAHPEKLSIGSSEIITRLGAEGLTQAAGISLTHVNYKGGGPIVTDVLGGHLPLGIVTPVSVQAFIKEGRIRPLAVTSPTRLATLPDVPTVAELLNAPGFDSQTWFALMAPAKTPPAVVQRLEQAVAKFMADPDFRKRVTDMGVVIESDPTPTGLTNLLKRFEQQNAPLVNRAGIKPE